MKSTGNQENSVTQYDRVDTLFPAEKIERREDDEVQIKPAEWPVPATGIPRNFSYGHG